MNPSLGGTIENHPKEWLWNQKWPNHFPRPFILNLFTAIIIIFYHFYQLHALIYGLEVYFGIKKLKIVEICIPIKMAPLEIDNLNFGNS
jgi:hypothetical protein